METSTKNENKQQKSKTSNQRHLPVLVFEIDSISKTRTSNEEQQKATNGKWKHAPKTKTSNNEQGKAPKGNEEQQKAKMDIGARKTKTGTE